MAPPDDLSIRIRRRLRALSERTRYRLGLPEPNVGPVQIRPAFRHPIDLHQKALLVSRYRERFPDAALSEVAEAFRLAAHRFSFLGHTAKHGPSISWSRDPISGQEWGRGFSPDIAFRGPSRLGDIKLPWELNKHQYFFTLGKAAWLAEEPSLALEILRQIDHWIADNPYARGINWVSALEAGTRAVSWILAFPFYAEFCDAPWRQRLAASLGQHMLFVERHLSFGRFANTHLVGEAAALVVGGLFLDCSRSAGWAAKGIALLEQELERQVTSDGVHVERSVAYHRFFLDHYYLVESLLRVNGQGLSSRAQVILERMTAFLMDMSLPDGSVMSFGDGDDARGLWMRTDCTTDYRSLLALGAVLFGRSDFKSIAGGPTEELLWLFGDIGLHAFAELPMDLPRHNSVSYPDGGYDVMRGGWRVSDPVLAFDCGPLGHGPAGHGHADALSFQLFAKGYPFLVDSGTFSYNIDYAWRDEFRSTRGHNTVVADGLDQSVTTGRMSWGRMAKAHRHRWLTTPWFDLVDGDHDGYHRLPDPVTHRRVVTFIKPDIWLVWDCLRGNADHSLDVLLHLRPDCSVENDSNGNGVVLRSPDGAGLGIRMLDAEGATVLPEILHGSEACNEAWFSPTYGVRVPTRVLRLRRKSLNHCEVTTCLSTSTAITPVLIKHDNAFCMEVRRSEEQKETIVYRPLAGHLLKKENIQFDGEVLYSRETTGGPTIVWASGFRELVVENILKVHSLEKIESLVLEGDCCLVVRGSAHTSNVGVDACDGVKVTIR